MSTEGAKPTMNQCGGYFGAELETHERIRYVQSQMRIAIQNHHLLFVRSQAFPKDADLENHKKILQDLILSLGRTQLELMHQFKAEVKEKHGENDLQNVMSMFLGWPDRHETNLLNGKENGAAADKDKKAQIMKKKPVLPQSAQPKAKMQSLLKVNHNKNILPSRKESERLKAASSKQYESPYSVLKEAKKLQSVLKARNEKLSHALVELSKQPTTNDEKTGDGDTPLKDSLSSDPIKIEDRATSIDEVTQDSFLRFFGLVHKDKSKNMIVTHTKRKRRSAAGQTSFYGDFSYFQAKRNYTKKAVVSSSVPESPSSSQDVVDADETDRLSLTSTDKPSQPTSPEIQSSQDVADSQEMAAPQGPDKLNVEDESESKMAEDGNSDGKTEPLTPESEDASRSPKAPSERNDDDAPKEAMEIDNSAQGEEDFRDLLNNDQSNVEIPCVVGEKMITEEGDSPNVTEAKSEILVTYSPKTGTVEESGDASAVQKPTSAEDQLTIEAPTSLQPNDESQHAKSSLHSKSQDLCSVCLDSCDAEMKKCTECGGNYHKDCDPSPSDSCPSCHATPTSISSIVGFNAASTLTSTDCSEVVKRYLDDTQDDSKRSVNNRDDDDSEEGANTIDTDDSRNSDADGPEETENTLHDVVALKDNVEIQDRPEPHADEDGNRDGIVNLLDNYDQLGFLNPCLFEENSSNSSSSL